MDYNSNTGRRLIATTIDNIASSDPHRPWISIPRNDNDLTKGFIDITFKQFSNGINHAAAWLESCLGPSTGTFDTFAYEGPKDARAYIITVAAVKVGRKILLPFPLVPDQAKLHLLDATGCKALVHDKSSRAFQSVLGERPHVRDMVVPELQEWITEKEAELYEYKKSWEEAANDPWIIFHTSGTTGLPRPVIYTNLMMTTFDSPQILSDPTVNKFMKNRIYSPAPAYHVSGILIGLQGPVWQGSTFIPGPALRQPSSALVGQILRYGQIEGIVSSPSVIRDLSRDPEMLLRLQSMKSISWVGGPLEKATGDVLCRHAKLSSAFGSTELGPLLTRVGADPTDWDYIWFAEGQGIEFDKWSEKLFELVIRRDESARFQQIFLLHPELEEYYTKDLFEKHPTKQDLWRYSGRKDDIVLLASGDLLHATEMEQVIMRHPTVQWALIGGDRRNRPCLLLQLADDVTTSANERDALISSVWPTVEAANSVCSEYVRLTKELTIFSDPARPFRRSGKDSLLRRETLALYEDDIDALYMRVNPSNVFVLKTE